MNVGCTILCDAPKGRLKYMGYGMFEHNKIMLPKVKTLGLIGGGTGVTPLLSIAQASCLANDGMEIVFLISNKTKNDILCKPELDLLASRCKNITIHHTLTRHNPQFHGARAGL